MLIIRHDHRAALAQLLDTIHAQLSTADSCTTPLEPWHTAAVLDQARELLRVDGVYLRPPSRARGTRLRQIVAVRANPTNGANNS